MPALALSLGVEIPNINAEAKTDGNGITGLPDGWTADATATTDLSFRRVPLQFGFGTSSSPAGAELLGSGWATEIVIPNGIAAATDRYIFTARSMDGQMFGAEQMNFLSRGYFSYVVAFRFRALGSVGAGNLDLGIRFYNADESAARDFTTAVLVGEMNNQWQTRTLTAFLDNTGWSGTPTEPDHCKLFVNVQGNTAGAEIRVDIDRAVVYSMGPLDFTTGSDSKSSTNQYYQMSRNYHFSGGLGPVTFLPTGRHSRGNSNRLRYYDPSGGVHRAALQFPHKYLTHDDWQMVHALWKMNRGAGPDSGSPFGNPLPIVAITNLIEHPMPYYCDFVGNFPIESYDGSFLPSATSGLLYRGTIRLEER